MIPGKQVPCVVIEGAQNSSFPEGKYTLDIRQGAQSSVESSVVLAIDAVFPYKVWNIIVWRPAELDISQQGLTILNVVYKTRSKTS